MGKEKFFGDFNIRAAQIVDRLALVWAEVVSWWAGVHAPASGSSRLSLLAYAVVILLVMGAVTWLALSWPSHQVDQGQAEATSEQAATAQQLAAHAASIAELQARVNLLLVAAAANPEPARVASPARRAATSSASQASAAQRQLEAMQQQQQQQQPPQTADQASAWGTTDLDRAIADFKPATAAP